MKSKEEVNGVEVIFPQATFTIQAFDTAVFSGYGTEDRTLEA